MKPRLSLAAMTAFAVLAATFIAAVPIAADGGVYAIRGGKVHTLTGEPVEGGTVLLRDGRIAAVGADVEVPAEAEAIDAAGLEVYPGLFDAFTRLGLTEIGAISATNDTTELGAFNPHLLATAGIHPASEIIPVTRANGITHAVSAPGSGGGRRGGGFDVGGQASLIHLAGWTVEEMAIAPSVGLVVHWPTISTRSFDFTTFTRRDRPFREVKKEYDEQVAALKEWFAAARHYEQAAAAGRVPRDLKLEAMVQVVRGEIPILVQARQERALRDAVDFATGEGFRIILVGAAEAYKLKDLLKEKDVPVLLGPTQSLPLHEDDPYDRSFTQAAELLEAGVAFAFTTGNASSARTLPYEAAQAVAFGLPWDEAVKAVTLHPAEILGFGDRLGTIEAGKIGNLVVTDGDVLEIRTRVRHVFIDGVPQSLDNRHLRLYETYRSRPRPTE